MNEEFSDNKPARAAGITRFHAKFQRYRNLFLRYWWVLFLAMPLAVVVQYWRLQTAPPQFFSTGEMIVNIKLNTQSGTIGSLYSEELGNFLGTQAALMQGETVQKRAADRVVAENQGIAPCKVKVDVSVLPKTSIFILRGAGGEPKYTEKFLQACMEEYILLKKEMAAHTSDTTIAGITEQIQKLEPQLNTVDEQIAAFLSTNDLALLEESAGKNSFLTILYQRLAESQSQYDLLKSMTLDQNLLIEQQHQPAMLRSGAASEVLGGNNVLVNAGLGDQSGLNIGNSIGMEYLSIKQQILLLNADKERFAEYLKPQHPRLVALDEAIARMNRLLAIYRDQSIEQLDARKSALELQIQNLQNQTKQLGRENLELSGKRLEYERIKARGQRIQSLYDQLLTSLQSLDVNKQIGPESVAVYQPASDAAPLPPELGLKLLLAALIGLGLGFGILFIVDRMDDRLNSFTELQEYFDEEVLGQIPREGSGRRKANLPLIQANDARMSFVESFRNLRSSLLYLKQSGQPPHTLLVTSSVPNDGKSLTAANLAVALAMSGSRVLIVDADLRKGSLHSRFDITAEKGLSQMLSQNLDWRKLIVETHFANLRLLPRGAAERHSTEFFFAADMERFLTEAGKEYDYVILDSPPVMAADDASTLAPRVDGVIFVIRAEQTSARVARASIDLLRQRNANILGLVFNAVRSGAGDYYHYYDRYKDYHTV
jgi:capsular exopolysaccharide synthesis family protein